MTLSPKIIPYFLSFLRLRLIALRSSLLSLRWYFITLRSWLFFLRSWLLSLQSWLLDLLYPKSCISCQKDGEILCASCFRKIQKMNVQECPVCRRRSRGGLVCHPFCKKFTSLDALIVSSLYQKNGILSKALHLFKYRFSEELGPILSSLLIDAFRANFSFSSTQFHWIIVPIPLHSHRLRWRGFNQSAILAKHVSSSLLLPFFPLLKRIRDGPSHALLSRKERMIAFDSVFEIDQSVLHNADASTLSMPSAPQCKHYSVLSKYVILVDDVATTLSTLNAASHALKSAGVEKVCGLVLGRGSFHSKKP
ncbi:ComF family protein [Candidatus Peregrinibacteria bacterium]|nr:ComF family protein [Candidatus Peregrinibacteria bacterium]